MVNSSCQLNYNCFQSFYAYFYDNIHPDIDRIGRWSFSKYEVDSVTTNRSESFNRVMKQFTDWKESAIDVMILILYRLFHSYDTQIMRSRYIRYLHFYIYFQLIVFICSRYNIGGEHTLCDHLTKTYNLEKDSPQLDEIKTVDQIMSDVQDAVKKAEKMVG